MESFEAFKEDATIKEQPVPVKDKPKSPTEVIESPETTKSNDTIAALEAHKVIDPSFAKRETSPVKSKSEEPPQSYPHLSRNDPDSPIDAHQRERDEEEETYQFDLAKSFQRNSSPSPGAFQRNRGAVVGKVGDDGVARMHKFTLYETANYYYIVGADLIDSAFRILKIHRTAEPDELLITEDDIVYNRKETYQILNAIDEGNRTTGGLKLKTAFWGIVGFIRFTGSYYMIYITKRSQVAMVGGHYIYQIDKTETMSLQTAAQAKIRNERYLDEGRYLNILTNLDLSRSFYFSYSYDVTRTLQYNIMREREALQDGLPEPTKADHNDMFVWNHHLLEPAKKVLRSPFDWCLPIIHGYVDQAGLSVYWGRMVYVTIIARRSRFFAGARFLKRGANDLGYVANDVETEQIVSEMLTTSFHAPGPKLFANSKYTSHVQHRGSIPLHWAQDSTGVNPKPDIQLNVVDPFFSAAALHFDNLFKRYSTPIYVLNLIKTRERTARESKLGKEFTTAIAYLNQFLPKDKEILYHAWDMSRASKSRDQDVIGSLEAIAEEILPKTGFFQNGNDPESGLKLQHGVARTNCIDCLDRTNAAQFVIAKKALGYQLQALGVIEDPFVEYDSDAINLFTHMWHDHGDTIAIQYGGSHLVNTMATYRKINQWTSHSRDMVESFKRYYNNSFMDAQRQEAYNLFLGNYTFDEGHPMLWELSTDYYLHHSDPRSMFGKRRPSYRHWYTDEYLETPKIPPSLWPHELSECPLDFFDDYWAEYYRPLALTSFKKLFAFKMHSNLRYIPISSTQGGKYDLSPFKVRTGHEADNDSHTKPANARRKGVKIIAPSDAASTLSKDSSIDARLASTSQDLTKPPKPQTLGPWLDAQQQNYGPNRRYTGIIKETSFQVASATPTIPKLPPSTSPLTTNGGTATGGIIPNQPPPPLTKAELAIQAFTALISNSLSPTVPETDEYHLYVTHPSNIPLVVSTETDYSNAPAEFIDYVSRTADPTSTSTIIPPTHATSNTNSNRHHQSHSHSRHTGTHHHHSSHSPHHHHNSKHPTQPHNTKLRPPQPSISTTATLKPSNPTTTTLDDRALTSLETYTDFIDSGTRDEPLTVLEEDGEKKRYKAYRQWLRGKSLFKQRVIVGGEVV